MQVDGTKLDELLVDVADTLTAFRLAERGRGKYPAAKRVEVAAVVLRRVGVRLFCQLGEWFAGNGLIAEAARMHRYADECSDDAVASLNIARASSRNAATRIRKRKSAVGQTKTAGRRRR